MSLPKALEPASVAAPASPDEAPGNGFELIPTADLSPRNDPVAAVAAKISWHDVLPIHPACEAVPQMSHDELMALGKDIKENGLRVPIVVLYTGSASQAEFKDRTKFALIDGRSRLDAMELVGIHFELVWKKRAEKWLLVSDEIDLPLRPVETLLVCDDPYALVASLNAHRRHLTAERNRSLIEELIKAAPEKSNRHIAGMAKASHVTVGAIREKLEATGQIDQLEKTVGKDGKPRAAKKKSALAKRRARAASTPSSDSAQRVSNLYFDVWSDLILDERTKFLDAVGPSSIWEAMNSDQRCVMAKLAAEGPRPPASPAERNPNSEPSMTEATAAVAKWLERFSTAERKAICDRAIAEAAKNFWVAISAPRCRLQRSPDKP